MTRFFLEADEAETGAETGAEEAEEEAEAEEEGSTTGLDGATTGFAADAAVTFSRGSNEEADMVADVPLPSSSPFRSVREQKTEWETPYRVPPVGMPGTAPHPPAGKRRGRTHRPER